jgi:predicted nucleotidyltransferase
MTGRPPRAAPEGANLPPIAIAPAPSRFTLAIRTLALRSGQGPLRPAWSGAYMTLIRVVAAVLRRRQADATVYVRGGFGRGGDPVFGLSDIDLLVILRGDPSRPRAARDRLMDDWRRLTRAMPALRRLVAVSAFEDAELADATSANVLTHGLPGQDGLCGRALFFGDDPLLDHFSFRSRPGLYGPMADWRRVAGGERRPLRRGTSERSLTAAWLELQCWWRYAVRACAQPGDWHTAYLSVKLIAEPVRILLWLRHGEQVFSRRRALECGLARLPEEEKAIRLGLELHRALARRPDSALHRVLPALLGLSERVAAEIARELEEAGVTEVALAGGETDPVAVSLAEDRPWGLLGGGEVLPLADWRGRALAAPPDELLVVLREADAADPTTLALAASAEAPGVVPAVPWGRLLVVPSLDTLTRPLPRGVLRSLQCAASDPVSHALVSKASTARFPEITGWSARDAARRAVAEQRARIARLRLADSVGDLAAVLAAARAALFLQSVQQGEPRLALTLAAVCTELASRVPGSAGVAAEAAAAWQDRRVPTPKLMRCLESAVRSVPPLRG